MVSQFHILSLILGIQAALACVYAWS